MVWVDSHTIYLFGWAIKAPRSHIKVPRSHIKVPRPNSFKAAMSDTFSTASSVALGPVGTTRFATRAFFFVYCRGCINGHTYVYIKVYMSMSLYMCVVTHIYIIYMHVFFTCKCICKDIEINMSIYIYLYKYTC